MQINELIKYLMASNVLASIIAFFIFLSIYTGLSFLIKKQEWKREKKRKISINIRNITIFLFFITMIFLWGGGIKTLALSAAAVCAAFFVAFKEIFLSFAGAISSNRIFSIGDYIEFDNHKGKIVDKNFLNTRVVLIDGIESKEVVFTNMHYITSKMVNLSRLGKYHTHYITIGVDNVGELYEHSQKILEITEKILHPLEDDYNNYFKEKSLSNIFFEKPSIKPIINYDITDSKKPFFKIQYIAHPLDNKSIETKILTEYIIYCKQLQEDNLKKQELLKQDFINQRTYYDNK